MKNKRLFEKAASVAVALFIWQVAAMLIDMDFLVASPLSVSVRLFEIVFDGSFAAVLWQSCRRIILGFFLGGVCGAIFGVVAGRFKIIEILLWPYMITVKSVPVASFVVIALIWLSSSVLSVFISFLIVLPIIYNNVLTGIRSVDPKISEMADVFGLSFSKRAVYVWLPALKSFLLSASKTAAGLAFKSGVAAEIIGIPSGSVGEQLYNAKVHLESADLLAWTVLIVAASAVFEKLFLWLFEKIYAGVERAL